MPLGTKRRTGFKVAIKGSPPRGEGVREGGGGGSGWSHPCVWAPNHQQQPSSPGTQICLGVPPWGWWCMGFGVLFSKPLCGGARPWWGVFRGSFRGDESLSLPADEIPAHPCRLSPSPRSSARVRAVTAQGAPRPLPRPPPRPASSPPELSVWFIEI